MTLRGTPIACIHIAQKQQKKTLLLKCQVALLDATDRKKAAGSSVHGPLNAGIVFDDQSQVNTFIDNYKPKKDATEKVWFQLPCYQG